MIDAPDVKLDHPLSVGRIAALAGVPTYSVVYAIASRGIEPLYRAGKTRVFDQAAVQRILQVLREMKSKRE